MAVEQVARWPWNAWPDERGLGGRMAWNPQIRQQLFPYAVAFQLFRLRRQSDIAVTGQHDLLLDEHHFDDATDDRVRGELSELLPKQVYEVERQPFLGLMSGLTNYTMADEFRVKQALDIAVATGDLLAVGKDGKTRRRKGTSIKSSDILIAPPQSPIFFVPQLKKSSSEN